MPGLHYSPVSYFSLGRVYPRTRLRENPLPVRSRAWIETLFPVSIISTISTVFLRGKWSSTKEFLGEWGYGVPAATTLQALNSALNPVLVGQSCPIRILSLNGDGPANALVFNVGKRENEPVLLVKTPTIDGTSVLVTLTVADVYALFTTYGPGDMYFELWETGSPVPMATGTFFIGSSMQGGM